MGELNKEIEKIRAQDAVLVVISPDNKGQTEEFLAAVGIEKREFTMLLDPEVTVIKQLQLFTENSLKGEAVPATLIIDKEGILRFKFIPQHYTERPPLEHIIEMLKIAQIKLH